MARAKKLCSHPACSNFQPCSLHQRKPWKGSTRRKRLPPNWEKIRQFILERDPICTECGKFASRVCDHRIPGDDHSYTNLRGICSNCDKRKSSREGHEARAALS